MNKKILAAVFSMALLCSCGNGNAGELSETGSESVSLASGSASETTVTTTSAETTSEAVSEETEIAAEVSEAEEKVPITRDFFNDDVVFEEVMLPVKSTSFYVDGTEQSVSFYEYDAAGNQYSYQEHTHEYDYITKYGYRPDGTYSRVFEYHNGEDTPSSTKFYDKHGYCIKYGNTDYEYKFDEAERLIRKTSIRNGVKEIFEYTYDEQGRLYKEDCFCFNEIVLYDYSCRHEYNDNIESIYYLGYNFEEEMLWKIIEKDENGNVIKETVNEGADLGEYRGKTFAEYKYDSQNRLIYENHTVSEDFLLDRYNEHYVHSDTYEYEGDKLKKRECTNYNNVWEYFYDEK
ncbi:MAG: hypothetical protein K2N71_08280, partial [Oscillospiraceae bacterium]|nr:hypothetical protein [Oscillospiraceae bacterium]